MKQECILQNSCHPDFYGHGVSPVDATRGVTVFPVDATGGGITGRPFGGVGFLWKKSLDASISVTESDYDWLCCLEICDGKKEYFLINVNL